MLASYLLPNQQQQEANSQGVLRVCAVSYLNTAPLVWGFRNQAAPEMELQMASPAECAEMLRRGEADLGLVPVAEIARQGLHVVPGTGIAARGAVRSILLFSRKPWEEVRTLAADHNSRSSVVLAALVLREQFGVTAVLRPHAPNLHAMLAEHDAALLIGDAALHVDPEALPFRWMDLGEEWTRITSLPMVFAAWAGPPSAATPDREAMFRQSLAYGLAHIEDIVEQEGPRHGVNNDLARSYLTRHIRYSLGDEEMAGMAEYLRRAEQHGLILPAAPAYSGR